MTPEERQLITGLFDRMRGFALTGKDGEAEALIKQQVGSLPDAPYMLVQSVLVQEHALQQADGRVKELEEQVERDRAERLEILETVNRSMAELTRPFNDILQKLGA